MSNPSPQATLEWAAGLRFNAAVGPHTLILDGERKAGCSPTEALMLALAGCTAGYGGEGPHGTLYVLRLCGFPEGATDSRGISTLEHTVFGACAFFLRRGAGGIERIGR